MTEQKIVEMLDELYNLRLEQTDLAAEASAAVRALIPLDVRDAMDAAQVSFDAQIDEAAKAAKLIEAEIKAATLKLGSKARGVGLQAIPTTRTKWDGKGLKGYAVANPEVLAFYSESKSVTIRRV